MGSLYSVVKEVLNSCEIVVGKLFNIIVRDGRVIFLCKLYECERQYLGYYRPIFTENRSLVFVENLADSHPLHSVGTDETFLFVLKHN